MGTKMRIEHKCDGKNCKHQKHSTRLSEEELEMATSIPIPKVVAEKMEFMLEKTAKDLEESRKYLYAGVAFLVVQVIGVFFNMPIVMVAGLIGWIIMFGFNHYHSRDTDRSIGFIDGVLYGQAKFAEGLKQFEDEVESGEKEVPEEIKEMIKQRREEDAVTMKE